MHIKFYMFKTIGVKIGLNILVCICRSYWKLYYSNWRYNKARKQAKNIIYTIYMGNFSRLVVGQSLVMPHAKHVYMLLPLVVLSVRHAHLGPTYMGNSEG